MLYDLRSSWATAEEIRAAGGVPEMCRVGHSFVKAAMREKGALFAGELSGHFYFRFSPTLVADDGIAALVAMLDVLGREAKPLSALIAPLRRYFASGEVSRRVARPAGDPRRARRASTRRRPSSRTWTACWSATTTGGSTCGRRTPSRCCASTSRRRARRAWQGERDRLLAKMV